MLCDQWKVTTDDLLVMVNAWQQAPGSAVTAQWTEASGLNASGPPVVFPRALFFSLARLHGDRGAQHILKRYSGGVERLQLPNAGFDIDQQSDLP